MRLLVERDGRAFLLEPGDEQETDLGVIDLPDDASPGDVVETHLGEPFHVRRLRGPDCFHHFERSGAPMTPKDVGLLLARTGIAAGDRVIDVGTGTGVLAAWLGLLGATVLTVEQDPAFAATARQNMASAGVTDRVTVVDGDAAAVLGACETEGNKSDGDESATDGETSAIRDAVFDGEPADGLTLDTGDAAKLVRRAPDWLHDDGVVAAYLPFVEDARETAAAARDVGIAVETHETIARPMQFDDRGSRPGTGGVGHTGYLVTGRL